MLDRNPASTNKHILSCYFSVKVSVLSPKHQKNFEWHKGPHILKQKTGFLILQLEWGPAWFKVNMRCQLAWNWAGYIAPTRCSRGRSTRLWSLLHSYGRLQRWNVRPVNTEGRKNHPIWHEHYKHTMNTPKCEITKHRRHQVLCNVKKKVPWLKNYAWWCMQNEGKSPMGWIQWLCNICMYNVTVRQHTLYMNQNNHAPICHTAGCVRCYWKQCI